MSQVAEVARQKRSMKINRYTYFRVDPLDELKGNLFRKGTNKLKGILMSRYICGHVEQEKC